MHLFLVNSTLTNLKTHTRKVIKDLIVSKRYKLTLKQKKKLEILKTASRKLSEITPQVIHQLVSNKIKIKAHVPSMVILFKLMKLAKNKSKK